jgi:hypothetical protein
MENKIGLMSYFGSRGKIRTWQCYVKLRIMWSSTLLPSELPAILAVFLGSGEFELHIILVYDKLLYASTGEARNGGYHGVGTSL